MPLGHRWQNSQAVPVVQPAVQRVRQLSQLLSRQASAGAEAIKMKGKELQAADFDKQDVMLWFALIVHTAVMFLVIKTAIQERKDAIKDMVGLGSSDNGDTFVQAIEAFFSPSGLRCTSSSCPCS